LGESYPVEFGEYRLLRKLAQGGMAEIFLAQDQKGEICAIKRILPHLAHEESFIRMFIDEARIVSHLHHPNVAGVRDQGKIGGYYFMAMEFVQGHSLLSLSERAKSMKIPLPRGLLAFIVGDLLAGLGCAHSARDSKGRHLGIVHRDVTPQNVLISYDGEVKLIDFGVAKARARLTQTEAGFTKGKLSYMSPEQARGEELDSRSDLFSVGIVLYEITTGTRLFNKEGPGGILGAIVNDTIPAPSMRIKEYPRDLETVCMRALEKDVDRRWQTAEEMRDSLMRFAKKEKPTPGKQRLKDLVHDLFGDPDSAKVIEAAKAVIAPTPAEVAVHKDSDVVRGASLRVKGSDMHVSVEELIEVPEPAIHRSIIGEKTKTTADETRMLRPDYEVKPKSRVHPKVEATSAGTPIVDLAIAQEGPVPEPSVPARVQMARFITAFAQDMRASWREHRRRWIGSGVAAAIVLVALITYIAGGFGRMASWMGSAVVSARELKTREGLDSKDQAPKDPTVLHLDSDPPGAKITLNGIGAGTVTPQDLADLPLGQAITLELELFGYRAHKEKVTLWPNQGRKDVLVKLERRLGSLMIDSDPAGAHVTVNGKPAEGVTPLRLTNLAADEPLKIAASKAGHVPKSVVATPMDGEEKRVMLELPVDRAAIPNGKISVTTSPPGCTVMIDDQPAGRSPLVGLDVRPGPHSVKASCDNYAPETRAVSTQPSKTEQVSFTLTPNVFGYLSINLVPAEGTVVEINGQRVQLPIEFRKVVPGHHVVVARNDGLGKKKEMPINVKPNERLVREINLLQ
jgi:serine/threonine-protein kinase